MSRRILDMREKRYEEEKRKRNCHSPFQLPTLSSPLFKTLPSH
jgi:hypothetical protein